MVQILYLTQVKQVNVRTNAEREIRLQGRRYVARILKVLLIAPPQLIGQNAKELIRGVQVINF